MKQNGHDKNHHHHKGNHHRNDQDGILGDVNINNSLVFEDVGASVLGRNSIPLDKPISLSPANKTMKSNDFENNNNESIELDQLGSLYLPSSETKAAMNAQHKLKTMPQRRLSFLSRSGPDTIKNTAQPTKPRITLAAAVDTVIKQNRQKTYALAMTDVMRRARVNAPNNLQRSDSLTSLGASEGGKSDHSQGATGNFLVDFPTSRQEFRERTPEIQEIATIGYGGGQGERSLTTNRTHQPEEIQDEADQRRPWRKTVIQPKPTLQHLSSFRSSVSSAVLFESDDQPIEQPQVTNENMLNPHEKVNLFMNQPTHYGTKTIQPKKHLHSTNHIDYDAAAKDDDSTVTELRLAQAALDWREDDTKSFHSRSHRGATAINSERRELLNTEEPAISDKFMDDLLAMAAKRVAAIRENQGNRKGVDGDEAMTDKYKDRIGTKTLSNGKKKARRPKERKQTLTRSRSLELIHNFDPNKQFFLRRSKSESDVGRLKNKNNDEAYSLAKSSRGHRKHLRRRQHYQRSWRQGKNKDDDDDRHKGHHQSNHRSKSRRREGDGGEHIEHGRRHRSKSQKHRNQMHRGGKKSLEGDQSVSGLRSHSRSTRETPLTEKITSHIRDRDRFIYTSDDGTEIPSHEFSEDAARASAMFGLGIFKQASSSVNEDARSDSGRQPHVSYGQHGDDDGALPSAVLGEDYDSDIEANDVHQEHKPEAHSLSNFHSVFAKAQKRPETSFHHLWSDSNSDSFSDDGSVGSHHSHRSTRSSRKARLQQVKLTLRTRGFGLKMQRICGAGVWAKKWYILGGIVLLIITILAVVISVATLNTKNSTPSPTQLLTVSPSTSPTNVLSFQLLNQVLGQKGGDSAGSSVSLSADGRVLAFGLPQIAEGSGEVRIFELQDGKLLPYGNTIVGATEGARFGSSISISDDGQRLAIGAPSANSKTGYAAVYQFDSVSELWEQLGDDLSLSQPNGWAGSAVSISGNGNRVAIGAPRSYNDDGFCLIFQYSSVTKTWTRVGQRIVGVGGELKGYSLSLDAVGETVAVGAVQSELSDGRKGRVYVYASEGSQWSLLGNSITSDDLFGRSVSLSADGKRLAIGATGFDSEDKENVGACAVYGFIGQWVQFGSSLQGNQSDERLGYSVSLSRDGQRLACGGPGGSVVRLFKEDNGEWSQIGLALKGASESEFGSAVSLNSDGSFVAIGAPGETVDGIPYVGAAMLYEG